MPRSSERPSTSDPIPTELLDHRYRLEALIGRGGMGAVYRALDIRLDRFVAIKMLRDVEGADAARFDAEVRTLARFAHPNLVKVFDAGKFEGRPYLVMELIDGSTLGRVLSEGPLLGGEAAKIGTGMAAALAYVHGEGIVHRDVKPANVLLDRNANAHLADFGIARLVDTTGMTATGLTLGTPAYLAPEQILGDEIGPRADVYALGLVLLECLTGRRAFEGTASEITAARLSRDPEIPGTLAPAWQQILRSMTNRDPNNRVDASTVVARLSTLERDDDDDGFLPTQFIDRNLIVPTTSSGDTTIFLGGRGYPATQPITPTVVASQQTRVLPAESVRTRGLLGRRGILAIGIAAGLVALVLGLTFGGVFSSSPSRKSNNDPHGGVPVVKSTTTSTSSTTTSTSTTTTSTTTTTIPAPSVSSAANGFVSALESGVNSGTVSPATAQQLDNLLEPLLFASSQPQQQIQQFDQLVQTYDQDVNNSMITGTSTINALSGAIQSLASALGTTVPTTTIPTTPGPPGNTGNTGDTGNSGGNGNGVGRGPGHGH